MVKRLSERTIATESVQGEGSWIRVRSLTVGEVLGLQRERETRASIWFKMGRIVGWVRRLFRKESNADRTEQVLLATIAKVSAWNWKDAADNDLPQPEDDTEIVFRLSEDEYAAIQRAVYGGTQSEEEKNS